MELYRLSPQMKKDIRAGKSGKDVGANEGALLFDFLADVYNRTGIEDIQFSVSTDALTVFDGDGNILDHVPLLPEC